MTTEVLAAAQWPMVAAIQDLSRMASDMHLTAACELATHMGRQDRLSGYAFASCPYSFHTQVQQWAAWRYGWNAEDIKLERADFARVPRVQRHP